MRTSPGLTLSGSTCLGSSTPTAKPPKIILAGAVKVGHFRRLATDERAARLLATLDDSFDDLFGDARVELPRRKIIQEKKAAPRPRKEDHSPTSPPSRSDRAMIFQAKCELQFRTHAVGRGRKPALLVEFEKRGIAPDRGLHPAFHLAAGVAFAMTAIFSTSRSRGVPMSTPDSCII